ncbi:MAG: TolC family protein [Pirellulales bacterium]
MRRALSKLLVVGVVACPGVAAAQTLRLPSITSDSSPANQLENSDIQFQSIARQQVVSSTDGSLPPTPSEGELLPPAIASPNGEVTLHDLEQMALAGNPAVAQAEARIRALRGRWVQVGLPPNPSAGYVASEIGDEGKAGQQGGYVGQEFITGGKLRLNRAVVSQEIQQAEQQFAGMQLRVQTDVRKAYYSALVAQRRADLAAELASVSGEAVKASQELLQAEEIPRAGLLQTQVEQQNAAILALAAQNDQQAAWRRLSAVVGSDLSIQRLTGDVGQLPGLLNWDDQLVRVTTTSPEVSAAMAELARAQTALQRARVEPIPDINTQFMVQFDNATEDTIAGVQMGIPLPLWNRNQGGIRQAEAEITQARRNADRVELNLKQRLAAAFQEYSTARSQAETYSTQILPKAKETFDLVQRGYRLGELGYLDLLNAQRTYSQTNLAYLDALGALWRSWADIEGLLLSDSLATPSQ